VQPCRPHWFLKEKSGFPFRTPAFCSVSRGQRRLGEKEYRAPSVTPGLHFAPELRVRPIGTSKGRCCARSADVDPGPSASRKKRSLPGGVVKQVKSIRSRPVQVLSSKCGASGGVSDLGVAASRSSLFEPAKMREARFAGDWLRRRRNSLVETPRKE
jgi:hypothetical protein